MCHILQMFTNLLRKSVNLVSHCREQFSTPRLHCVSYSEISSIPTLYSMQVQQRGLGELKGKYIQWMGNNVTQQWKQEHIKSQVVFRGWRTNMLDINSRSKGEARCKHCFYSWRFLPYLSITAFYSQPTNFVNWGHRL